MHELGVVFYVIRDVKAVAEANHVSRITRVTLEIGEVSGVVHELLEDCWKWAIKKEPLMDEAQLEIETIPAVTFCEDCKQEYETVRYAKICPYCGSENTFLVRGDEFLIKEIEVEDPSEDPLEEPEEEP